MGLLAPDELLLHAFVGADVHHHRVCGEQLDRLGIVQVADAAARIVDEMFVPVDVVRLLDEVDDVAHGGDFRIMVQALAGQELLAGEPALRRISDLAEKGRERLQVWTVMLLRM